MKTRQSVIIILCAMAGTGMWGGCNKPSRVEQHRAEKHQSDSVRLEEQIRTLGFYQMQLDSLMPVSDSLIALFEYERNEQYQDHGYYVVKKAAFKKMPSDLRIMVRDDGKDIAVYKSGKRLSEEESMSLDGTPGGEAYGAAQHLQIVIRDIRECENRIDHTSLEVQKYQKRLQKN